jgi:hypothetical protein
MKEQVWGVQTNKKCKNFTLFILQCPAQWMADSAFRFANIVKPAQNT